MQQPVEFRNTKNPNLKVKITSSRSGAKITLYGYLVSSETYMPIKGINKRKITFDINEANEDDAIVKLINRLLNDYSTKATRSKSGQNDKSKPFAKGVYSSAFSELDNESHSFFAQANWSRNTLDSTIATFKKALAMLDEFSLEVKQTDFDSIREKLIENAYNDKRSYKDYELAASNKAPALKRIDKCLALMYDQYTYFPRLFFDAKAIRRHKESEEYKSITPAVRYNLINAIFSDIGNGLALGVAVMLLAGPRTAEAAALKIGDIKIINNKFAVFSITHQLDKKSQLDPYLKTDASYRMVIAPYLFVKILESRIEYLKSKGFNNAEISSMPLVSSKSDPKKLCRTYDLSSYGKALLISSGLTQEDYDIYIKLSFKEPDYLPNNRRNPDITNYICRRDFASRCANVCGLLPEEVDYLMGHKNEKAAQIDFTNKDTQSAIAKKLEISVLHNNYSLNPYINPISLTSEKSLDVDGYGSYRFVNDSNQYILATINNLVSTERCQTIILKTNGQIENEGIISRGRLAVGDKCNAEPPITTNYETRYNVEKRNNAS